MSDPREVLDDPADVTAAEQTVDLLIVRVDRRSDVWLVRLIGEVDLSTTELLREHLEPLEGDVVVDLAWLEFLDSSGIATFNVHRRRIEDGGRRFRMRRPISNVRRVLWLVGLEDWIDD